jgi:PAS domain S-box-containing protein
MNEGLRILMVEDMAEDANLVEHKLRAQTMDFVLKRVDTLEDFERELASFVPDLILSDYALEGFNGMDVLQMSRRLAPRLPFVMVTGSADEEVAVKCMKAGADDYVLKGQLGRLGTAILGAIEKKRARRERELAEEALRQSERRYRALFERNLAGVLQTVGDGRIVHCNEACARILGCASHQEALNHQVWDFWANPLDKLAFAERLQHEKSVSNSECRLQRKDGTMIWVLISAHLNGCETTDAAAIQATIIDITERKRAEEAFQASLREKELLLKEIHHRVKNNLQVICSLLQLRARAIPNGEALEMFLESQTRVRTMALIHEKLYQSKDFAHIDFGEYVRSLVTDLMCTYRTHSEAVDFSLKGSHVVLGVDAAVPCALIVNELVSNSLKHAFPGGRRGSIDIALSSSNDGKVRLVVRDDGVGLPDSLDSRQARSLGLQLVNTLTDQLGGTIELRRNGGTEFQIEFAA